MHRSILLALFSLLILSFTLANATSSNSTISQSAPFPNTTTTTQKHENPIVKSKSDIATGTTPLKIELTTKKYSSSDFAHFDASDVKISVIVGIKDYNPRVFTPLVQKLSYLLEESRKVLKKELEIFLVHYGPSETIQSELVNRMTQLFSTQFRYIGPESWTETAKLNTALNRAATLATGDALFFASDMLSDVSISSLQYLAKVLKHPDIGIAAPRLLDASKGDSVIFSAGIDFVLGKNPHKSAWGNWNSDTSGTSALHEKADVPLLQHRYQGYLESDSRVKEMQAIYGASKYGFMIKASHWRELKGFDLTLDQSYLDVDLCLRSRSHYGKVTLFVPQSTVSVTGQDTTPDDTLAGDYVQNEALKGDNRRFLEKWLEPLMEELTSGWLLQELTVVWSMDCGTGQILGFTTETVNLLLELQKYVRVKVNNDVAVCRAELTKIGFPEATIKMIHILSLREDREVPSDKVAVVMHKDPMRYDSSYAYNPPDLLIGRSMYETDSIPADWVESIKSVDFVWVPSQFNVQTFASAGVNASKLEIVHEAIDLLHFDPTSIHLPSSGISPSPETLPDRAKFNFISVFKWESRKDWETLVTAFYDEFANSTDTEHVRLYIRSSMAPENRQALIAFQERYMSTSKLSTNQLPKIIPLNRFVPYHKLPHMYKAAQAFVIATHGEGWGLPIMEAMSMGLPVITTDWSGLTEFVTPETSYPVEYEIVSAHQEGHKWAKANLKSLRHKMRQVYSDPAKAASVGQLARSHLLNNFSTTKTVKGIIEKIQQQIPHFATLKTSRPAPSLNFGRNRFGSSQSSTFYGNQGSTSTSASWSAGNTVEKYGLTLTKGKVTE